MTAVGYDALRVDSGKKSEAKAKNPGILRKIFNSMMESRMRQAEQIVADYKRIHQEYGTR